MEVVVGSYAVLALSIAYKLLEDVSDSTGDSGGRYMVVMSSDATPSTSFSSSSSTDSFISSIRDVATAAALTSGTAAVVFELLPKAGHRSGWIEVLQPVGLFQDIIVVLSEGMQSVLLLALVRGSRSSHGSCH